MNEEQIAVVKETWGRVVPIADTAATLFYSRLFELDPSIEGMFPDDLTEQKKKLMATLSRLVSSLSRIEDMIPTVAQLGRKHVGYGVEEAHYATVGSALLWTLEQGLGDAWDSEVKAAWTEVYGLVSGVMIGAAREAMAASA